MVTVGRCEKRAVSHGHTALSGMIHLPEFPAERTYCSHKTSQDLILAKPVKNKLLATLCQVHLHIKQRKYVLFSLYQLPPAPAAVTYEARLMYQCV